MSSGKPPKFVKTIRDLICWQYAKLIAKAAGFKDNYAFITDRYKKLKSGEITWSSILREDQECLMMEERCIYCGSKQDLSFDHIIPLHRGGPDIISNQVLACKSCNSSKGKKDIFEWYGMDKLENIPRIVMGKYLKLVYDFHEQQGTLDKADLNQDGQLDVLDLSIFLVR